ncbi:hypothetical protein NBRC116590_14440 [Pelagimonas sp. KU-00592-HH]|uniref:LysR family transcriptional regulator n=1 Tax=Pelagimonas sp. KU-00592-HH TaxID=3127651 RepID=UPI003109717D
MARDDLSLRGLELFQLAAAAGSLQAVARETGLSVSTVSHHLKTLEAQLGVSLLDHGRRPMVLTPAGGVFLKHVDEALRLIRRARAEASAGNITEATHLRIGMIEDFDSDIGPELAVFLSEAMPKCDFLHRTDHSHMLLEMLRNRALDIGVAMRPADAVLEAQEYPLLRDPFVVALPAQSEVTPEDCLAGRAGMPFLRYTQNQIMGRQIEAQLRRMKRVLPTRFEIENNQTIMAMVAAGAGWCVTTPMLYARAKRFHGRVRLHEFPGKSFARNISVFATQDCSESVVRMVDVKLRALLALHAIQPVHEAMPWLADGFRLLEGE